MKKQTKLTHTYVEHTDHNMIHTRRIITRVRKKKQKQKRKERSRDIHTYIIYTQHTAHSTPRGGMTSTPGKAAVACTSSR